MTLPITPAVRAELAPTGVLRAGINLSNFLLVTSKDEKTGDPCGVSPDMARELAARLGVPVKLVPFDSPGKLADAAGSGVWDIGLMGAEPSRAEQIAFTAAYVEIEATYLVPAGSTIASIAEVDSPGVRIAVSARSAYDLYLSRSLKHAMLVRIEGIDGAYRHFVKEGLEALAGLKPGLLGNVEELKGSRIIDGRFTTVQQATGTPIKNQAGAAFLKRFVEEVKASGFVAGLIAKHHVRGLSVAPAAPD
jgi:polar amino acid transport system substrate-binding protein